MKDDEELLELRDVEVDAEVEVKVEASDEGDWTNGRATAAVAMVEEKMLMMITNTCGGY